MEITNAQIIEYLRTTSFVFEFQGNKNNHIKQFCPLRGLKNESITWINFSDTFDLAELEQVRSLLVVTHLKDKNRFKKSAFDYIFCQDPRALYFAILENYFQTSNYKPFISPHAVIESKQIGKDVYIGHHTYIGEDVQIGNNCVIKNNVSIEGRVTIGDNTIIHSGVVIGLDGFGFVKDENNNNKRVPHYGGVIIGHDCEISANCCISRGCLDDTVIGNYVKFDNMSHIGHNDRIGDNCEIVLATLSGSVTVGENTWVGVRSVIKEGITIGKDCVVGAGAVVTKDVSDGKVVAGVPAKILRYSYDENGVIRR